MALLWLYLQAICQHERRSVESLVLTLHVICQCITTICVVFFPGRGVTIVSGDRPICFVQGGSIRLYLLWISSPFVATTLAVFSNHQLSCQINEPFYCLCCRGSTTGENKQWWIKGEGCFGNKDCQKKKTKRKENMGAQQRVLPTWAGLVHFTSGRKGENMWKFYDPKRNTVFRKSDDKMSWAEDVQIKLKMWLVTLFSQGPRKRSASAFHAVHLLFFCLFCFFTPFLAPCCRRSIFAKSARMQFSCKLWRLWCSRLHRVQFTAILAKLRKSVFREEISSCRPSAVFSPCTAAAHRQSLHCRQ